MRVGHTVKECFVSEQVTYEQKLFQSQL